MKRSFITAALYSTAVYAQTVKEREEFAEFNAVLEPLGYDWEPHNIKTEDGWHLTMFRVTGRNGERPATTDANKGKPPILYQHGAGESATTHSAGGLFNPALPLRLVDEGYDVWLGNSRGTLYSNKHDRDGDWSIQERWNFDWTSMGLYDIPAYVNRVLEVTEKPKLTLVAYSQGSNQSIYGLAHLQDFFSERLERFVALSPCVDAAPYTGRSSQAIFDAMKDVSEEKYFAPTLDNPTLVPMKAKIDCSKTKEPDCEYETGDPSAVRYYQMQIATEKRFQEPMSVEQWAKSSRITPLVPLDKIDRIPVSFVLAMSDNKLCVPQKQEAIFNAIGSPEKYLRWERGGHLIWVLRADDAIFRRLVQTIETGRAEADIPETTSFAEMVITNLVATFIY